MPKQKHKNYAVQFVSRCNSDRLHMKTTIPCGEYKDVIQFPEGATELVDFCDNEFGYCYQGGVLKYNNTLYFAEFWLYDNADHVTLCLDKEVEIRDGLYYIKGDDHVLGITKELQNQRHTMRPKTAEEVGYTSLNESFRCVICQQRYPIRDVLVDENRRLNCPTLKCNGHNEQLIKVIK